MRRADSLEKTLMLGGIEGRRRRWPRMGWLDGITDSMDMSLSELPDGQGGLSCCDSWGRKESDTTERLNWTELNWWLSSQGSTCQRRRSTCQWIPSLGWEDHLEKEMATCSSILAWKTPWREETSRLLSTRSERVRHNLVTEHQLIYNVVLVSDR